MLAAAKDLNGRSILSQKYFIGKTDQHLWLLIRRVKYFDNDTICFEYL